MQDNHSSIITDINQIPQGTVSKSKDCRDILQEFSAAFFEVNHYLEVGECSPRGWTLHISSIRLQFTALLYAVIPVLTEARVAFKIPKDKNTARDLIDGTLGYTQLGKLIYIYPESKNDAISLARILIESTKEFRAPLIPGTKLLGGTVSTVYETMKDGYTIPFSLPNGVNWIFEEIVPHNSKSSDRKKLLNFRYRPLALIKSDVKGRVIQANYFKSFFNIKLCVLKEGVKNMWADDFGRDIIDRIEWQYKIYKSLSGQVLTPKIFDLFKEDENTYLAIEYIKGESFRQKIDAIYKENSWHSVSPKQRLLIINYLLDILAAVQKLHENGYVHRDLMPENFIVTKDNKIYLIDMELTYSIPLNYPSPAFKLGTAGYMSPEQEKRHVPTVKEDIYALGCLLFFSFTGMSPVKLDKANKENIYTNGIIFNGNPQLSLLIQNCLNINPDDRPNLSFIRSEIELFENQLKSNSGSANTSASSIEEPDSFVLTALINQALKGLANPKMMTNENVWTSLKGGNDNLTDTRSTDRSPLPGFYSGVSGVLYILARAKKLGYTVDSCLPAFRASWNYIDTLYSDSAADIPKGFYDGLAGIALAIKEGIEVGLLDKTIYQPGLEQLFQSHSGKIDLATGISGQGFILLKCKSQLRTEFYEPIATDYVNILLTSQQKEGSWLLPRNTGRKQDNITGLAHGTAGVLLFLLNYYEIYPETKTLNGLTKGLWWLIKQAEEINGAYVWNISTKSKTAYTSNCSLGVPGIALIFLKAYEILKVEAYRKVAEKSLISLPNRPITVDYTQAHGLAGLGEVYMEAFRVLHNNIFMERATWIANIFIHTFLKDKKSNYGYWFSGISDLPECDLMTGNAGIINFLIRYQAPDQKSWIH